MSKESNDPKTIDPSQTVAVSALLAEVSTETRSRRDPEHLYTAASVGAFGAVAWGVAALTVNQKIREAWSLTHPAFIAAVGILVIAIVVIIKIVREHLLHTALRKEQVRLAKLLIKTANLPDDTLPPGLKSSSDGPGYKYSVAIVLVAALFTAAFCFAIWGGDSISSANQRVNQTARTAAVLKR